jgi:hypothetical protein
MIVGRFILPEYFGYFFSIMNEFRAAGPEGRADSGDNVCRTTLKLFLHDMNRSPGNIPNAAAPAGMDVGNNPAQRIIENNRLAICQLDGQKLSRSSGNKRISGSQNLFGAPIGNEFFRIHYKDLITVDLMRIDQILTSDGSGDNPAVLLYARWPIAKAETHI